MNSFTVHDRCVSLLRAIEREAIQIRRDAPCKQIQRVTKAFQNINEKETR